MVQDSNSGQQISATNPSVNAEVVLNLDRLVSLIKSQTDFNYNWVETKDKSLTLKSLTEPSEWMHSLHGAYSESQYIYGGAIRLALKSYDRSKQLNILSMGLGLGYVEFIAICECLKVGQKFKVYSYESDTSLQSLFQIHYQMLWMMINKSKLNIEFKNLYKNKFSLDFVGLKNNFLNLFIKDYKSDLELIGFSPHNPVIHQGPFSKKSVINSTTKFQVVLYDAFSSNTQSELWNEDFISYFLEALIDPDFCVFTTYAKVGALTRALKKTGFGLEPKKGYAFKRESTLALLKR